MKVIKRNGNSVEFDLSKVVSSVSLAMEETVMGIDTELAYAIALQVQDTFTSAGKDPFVEEIQDVIETLLMGSNRKDVAKAYILYRDTKNRERSFATGPQRSSLLSEEFLSQYKHRPMPMKQLGSFVFYRTYSRWISDKNRREEWWETVKRAVEYNCSLVPSTTREEAEALYDAVYNLRLFLAGRTFWIGGTSVARDFPMSNFNCSFKIINDIESYRDLFYLLLIGSGVGVRVLKKDVEQLPKFRTDINLVHEAYTPVPSSKRGEYTALSFPNKDVAKITVGDSKEGWVNSLDYFLKIHTCREYRHIHTIIINYDNVRKKGERLKTFGGTASGYESLQIMFSKISRILHRVKSARNCVECALAPIDCLDIANIIGENVICGGVRRTSEIGMIDTEDTESINAKQNLYQQVNGSWVPNEDILHRQMSNNSVMYEKRPTREQLHENLKKIRFSGEPGFINKEAAARRRKDFEGVNPCFTGTMRLLTTDGYQTFASLEGKEVSLINAFGKVSPRCQVWCSGKKSVVEVRASHRRTVLCTEDHVFMLADGSECQAKDLIGKTLMPPIAHRTDSVPSYTRYGYIHGVGYSDKRTRGHRLLKTLRLSAQNQDIKDLFQTESSFVPLEDYFREMQDLGFESYSSRFYRFPKTFDSWTDVEQLNFLKGVFSADAIIDRKKSILFRSKSILALNAIKKALNKFGISCRVNLETGKLRISHYDSMVQYYNLIGFVQPVLTERLEEGLTLLASIVKRVTYLPIKAKVYDFSEPLDHWGVVEGTVVHNCAEILLGDRGLCNLTTLNVLAFVREGQLDVVELLRAQRLSARASYRMTQVELELPKWNTEQKKNRLTGCSLTGWQDMVNAVGMNTEKEAEVLEQLRNTAHKENEAYAKSLNCTPSLLVTTVKPEGCLTKDHLRVMDQGLYYIDEMTSDTLQPGWHKVEHFTTRRQLVKKLFVNDPKELVNLTLLNGRKVTCTLSHPFSVAGQWVEAAKLVPGMVLDHALNTYNKYKHAPLALIDDQDTMEEMDEKLAFLCGVFLTKGSLITEDRIELKNLLLRYSYLVQKLAKEIFGVSNPTETLFYERRSNEFQESMTFTNPLILRKLRENGLCSLVDNRLPLIIRTSAKKDLLNFIGGILSGYIRSTSIYPIFHDLPLALARSIQEAGEAVGLCFSLVACQKEEHEESTATLKLLAHKSSTDAIFHSRMTYLLQTLTTDVCDHEPVIDPYTIAYIDSVQTDTTYDIEVEDEHWYYQGSLVSHNTLSLLPTVSSGVHYNHSDYYIRRVRISAKDPLCKVAEELDWSILPEVGQTEENCSTKVIEFPVKGYEGRNKYDVTAIEQLENYRLFMQHYVDHNVSITVSVKEHEWEGVEEWLWKNWDEVVAISFMPLDDSYYQLMPYEMISKEEYERRVLGMKPFISSLITKYEIQQSDSEVSQDSCETGVCPVR